MIPPTLGVHRRAHKRQIVFFFFCVRKISNENRVGSWAWAVWDYFAALAVCFLSAMRDRIQDESSVFDGDISTKAGLRDKVQMNPRQFFGVRIGHLFR